jgi:phosphoribosylanthranilate isomerase
MTLVKICGITRVEDALAAADAGADAIGFIFWEKSPRFIDPYRARAIAAALPPFIATVGVFVNQPAEHIAGVVALVRLSAVQLHGDETPAFAGTVQRPIVKAVNVASTDLDRWPPHVVLLLDADDNVLRGGTGRQIDWTTAAAIAGRRRVLLAGGLTPENVAEALARVRPYGIDVSSGVEDAPGRKNHERLRALFRAIYAHEPARQA